MSRPLDDRLPPLPESQWSEAQRVCAEEIIQGPRGALIEPFVPMLRSPELCTHTQRTGEYLRYRSAIGLRLSELAILVTARHWTQQVEWAIHAPIAMREGIAADVVDAIAHRTAPPFVKEDEALVYAFVQESLNDKKISQTTWSQAVTSLGEQGAVDLLGIIGYYSMLSVVMNGAQTPAPAHLPMRLPD